MEKREILEQLDQWQRFQRAAVDALIDLGVPDVSLMQIGASVADAQLRKWQAERQRLAVARPIPQPFGPIRN